MPALVAWLLRGLTTLFLTYGADFLARATLGIGLAIVVEKVALPNVTAWLQQHSSGLPNYIVDLFTYIRVGQAVSLVLSAYVARETVRFVGKKS